jgi:signal transduction histidine kinase
LLLFVALAAVVAGEAGSRAGRSLSLVAVDALAGATFLATGAVSAGRRGGRRFATLSFGAGLAWFAANVVSVLAPLHRPLLVHTVLGAPDGRLRGRAALGTVVAAWVIVLMAPGTARMVASCALGLAVVAVTGPAALAGPLTRRTTAGAVALAAVPLGLALAGPPLVRLWRPVSPAAGAVAVGYAALVALAGSVLLVGMVLRWRRRPELADAVVELTELGRHDVHAMLESLDGDGAGAAEPAVADVLAAVAALLDENRVLHDELAAQVEEVRRSRRRLVDAADVERRRLASRLASGTGPLLDELEATLGSLARLPGQDPDIHERLAAEVAAARDDLERLARGLHPRLLVEAGLRASLDDLARRSPVETTVLVPDRRFPASAETTVWYVCAEAAANVAKHAGAREMRIEVVAEPAELVATVSDDGRGGARSAPASGLAGLADRLDAVGGRLEVSDRAGGGTSLRAWVPVA